jgi:integrase
MPRKKAAGENPPEKRRARGTGSVFYSESRGVWVGRKIVGKKPNGDPLYVERSHAKQEVMLRLLDAAGPPGPQTTLAQWAARWLETYDRRASTKESAEVAVRVHILPTLGGQKVATLTAAQVQGAARRWLDAGLEPGTVRLILTRLSACLTEAVHAGLRADNPLRFVRRPKLAKAEYNLFTEEELESIIEEAGCSEWTRAVAVLAATGMRAGEVVALDVTDYDPKTGRLSVTKTSDRKRRPGPPKSERSNRVIRVPAVARPAIEAAVGGRTSGPMFLTRKAGRGKGGDRVHYGTLCRNWKVMLGRMGLPYRNAHQLRHSVASLLVARKFSPADAARYLGDTFETFVRTYVHPTGADASEVLEEALGGRKVGATGRKRKSA